VVAGVGADELPVRMRGGAGAWWPLGSGCRRDGGAAEARRGAGRFCRSLGRSLCARQPSRRAGKEARLGGGHGGQRLRGRARKKQQPLIKASGHAGEAMLRG
jgi:hypothetical protein